MMHYEKNWLWIQLSIFLNLMTVNQCWYFVWHIIHSNDSYEMIQKLLMMKWVITFQKCEKSILFVAVYHQKFCFFWKMIAWLMTVFCFHNFNVSAWNFFFLNNDNIICEKNKYQKIWFAVFTMINLFETWSDFES